MNFLGRGPFIHGFHYNFLKVFQKQSLLSLISQENVNIGFKNNFHFGLDEINDQRRKKIYWKHVKITKQGDVFCFIKFEIDRIIVVSKCNAFKICPTKKSVIRTIFKMIADGMNNAQNEWVCNITERFRERTMFCNFFLLFFSLAQSHLTFRSTSRL